MSDSDTAELFMSPAERLLITYWDDFCAADPTYPEFADEMERAGFIELVDVTEDALEESFAAERGIERGGMMWQLTPEGRAVLDRRPASP